MKSKYLLLIICLLPMCKSSPNPDKDKKEDISIDSTEYDSATKIPATEDSYQCNYLNEPLPDSIPKLFVKDVISTGVDESSFEINKYGDEMIFAREGKIMILHKTDTGWTEPTVATFSGKQIDGECCFSPGGDKIYFASRRPLPGAAEPMNTWISEKINNIWQDPNPVKEPLYHQTTHAVTVSSSGNLYCSGIDLYTYLNNQFSQKVEAGPNLKGTHPFVAPDESYILFCKRVEGRRDPDIFISLNSTW